MRDALPAGVPWARLGGEEFGILFTQIPLDQVQQIVTQICDGVHVSVGRTKSIVITASAGILEVDCDIAKRRAFQLADAASYEAKSAGRARYAMAHAVANEASKPHGQFGCNAVA
jgi:GGDEF domain-containing protein